MIRAARPPERFDLGDYVLRRLQVADAAMIARAVRESLDHLLPFMPWAGEPSTREDFQFERLTRAQQQWAAGEAYEYGVFDRSDTQALGGFGLTARRGRGTLEIGYWLHVDAQGRGIATRAARALTDAALAVRGVKIVLIYTDEANTRSAAVPQRLGYRLLRIDATTPAAPAETGRHLVWARQTPVDVDQ